jgi:hypothetical protein
MARAYVAASTGAPAKEGFVLGKSPLFPKGFLFVILIACKTRISSKSTQTETLP